MLTKRKKNKKDFAVFCQSTLISDLVLIFDDTAFIIPTMLAHNITVTKDDEQIHILE